ncbi:hypothetical protein [Xanthomonas theicola]|uniref:hypothetical protein n=1 Tax=Xanthomonas theicola TaxID=56464 RepID=UPI001FE3D100|nr:hypothetical protein [Xanthomonas theicola]
MLIKLLERVPPAHLLVVHASLGASEWHGALEHAQEQAEAAGLPFLVARARKSFLDMVEHRFKVRPGPNSSCGPSAANRQCTMLQPNKRNTIRGREWWEWLPIHEMPTDEVWHTIAAAGQVPHPAYLAGNQRLSCVFCILASPRDLANGARHRPELFERYREVEQRTGYTMHQSRRSLAELVEQGRAELQRGGFDLDEPAFLDGAGRTHHDTDSQSHD